MICKGEGASIWRGSETPCGTASARRSDIADSQRGRLGRLLLQTEAQGGGQGHRDDAWGESSYIYVEFSEILNNFQNNICLKRIRNWAKFVFKVAKRLKIEKEMEIARLVITEVDEKSSPDSPQVGIEM